MSNGPFASMTASLFSRDGYNMPASEIISSSNLVSIPRRSGADVETPRHTEPAKSWGRPPPGDTNRPRKVRISLSDKEFEAFGIAAVKRGATRNQILREALNFYLDKLADDYGKSCGCLANAAGKAHCPCTQ
jgi:hypothetical protein